MCRNRPPSSCESQQERSSINWQPTTPAKVKHVFTTISVVGSMVDTAPDVLGWKGENIQLPCVIREEAYAMYWVKGTISGQQETKAGFSDGIFESFEDRFDIDKNFSLVITDLEVADEGLYFCQVALSNLQIFENSTFLTVNSMASRHEIEECSDESLANQSRCTYQTSSNTPIIDLTCVVSGFKPNISMLWTEESGKRLNSVVSQQTTLSDDTYERLETINVSTSHETEQSFMCVATGDSLNGTATIGITVLPSPGLSPSPLPLTVEEVLQCKQDLKAFYRRTRRKVTVNPLNLMERVNLDEIYTNLSLKESGDMRETPKTYEDLLTNDKSGILSERILIQGEAGVGKTSLCSKIAWDWCHGRILQDLDMVIVIPLRDVTVDKTIGAIVERYLSDSNEATAQQLDKYIAANLSKILLVLDGFDEFNEKIEKSSRSEVIRILGLEQYKTCRVIVTTRQWRSHELTMVKSLSKAYNCITIAGFSQQNLLNYISRYFLIRENDARRKSLISFMEESDVIRSYMVPFPIYCAMLCLMWNEFSEERRKELEKMQTFSESFGEMICFLKEDYASKFCDDIQNQKVVEDIQEAGRAIQAIGEIALLGLLERKFSFSQEQFKNYQDALETCCKVGVLTNEKDIINRKRRRDANIQSVVVSTVSFPHKLFQNYIAGVHIEFLFASDHAEYHKVKDKLLSRYEEFRYLLYFASAFRKEVGFDIIDGLIKKDDQNFCLDVAFECHTEEASKVVGERWKAYELSRSMSDHTKSGVVFILHCNQVVSDYLKLDIIR
ncbi:NLR family CARD domain-containing protein 4-like [Diadema antillarum]|uniref:NLR family CARD domain-containing protein 4-like n=1 Tax=Diadema antillarum TaxID=105358 RepID=UPI003A85E2D4